MFKKIIKAICTFLKKPKRRRQIKKQLDKLYKEAMKPLKLE